MHVQYYYFVDVFYSGSQNIAFKCGINVSMCLVFAKHYRISHANATKYIQFVNAIDR